jgi:hypothetical protein
MESEGRQMKSSVWMSYIKKEKHPKNPSFKEKIMLKKVKNKFEQIITIKKAQTAHIYNCLV